MAASMEILLLLFLKKKLTIVRFLAIYTTFKVSICHLNRAISSLLHALLLCTLTFLTYTLSALHSMAPKEEENLTGPKKSLIIKLKIGKDKFPRGLWGLKEKSNSLLLAIKVGKDNLPGQKRNIDDAEVEQPPPKRPKSALKTNVFTVPPKNVHFSEQLVDICDLSVAGPSEPEELVAFQPSPYPGEDTRGWVDPDLVVWGDNNIPKRYETVQRREELIEELEDLLYGDFAYVCLLRYIFGLV
jgi:hypothetical protein